MKQTKFINNFWGYGLLLPISTFLYTGMIRFPGMKRGSGGGTITSIFTSGLFIAMYDWHLSYITMTIITLIVGIIGIINVGQAERFLRFKSGERPRHTGEIVKYDFNETTIDETWGVLVAACLIYVANDNFGYEFSFWEFFSLQIVALAFFRIFDIWKPGPIKWIENKGNLESSIIIMIDDFVAGVFAIPFVAIAILVVYLLR